MQRDNATDNWGLLLFVTYFKYLLYVCFNKLNIFTKFIVAFLTRYIIIQMIHSITPENLEYKINGQMLFQILNDFCDF